MLATSSCASLPQRPVTNPLHAAAAGRPARITLCASAVIDSFSSLALLLVFVCARAHTLVCVRVCARVSYNTSLEGSC